MTLLSQEYFDDPAWSDFWINEISKYLESVENIGRWVINQPTWFVPFSALFGFLALVIVTLFRFLPFFLAGSVIIGFGTFCISLFLFYFYLVYQLVISISSTVWLAVYILVGTVLYWFLFVLLVWISIEITLFELLILRKFWSKFGHGRIW